eukprot:6193941-Pleurochrysis_carterae.AAC.1
MWLGCMLSVWRLVRGGCDGAVSSLRRTWQGGLAADARALPVRARAHGGEAGGRRLLAGEAFHAWCRLRGACAAHGAQTAAATADTPAALLAGQRAVERAVWNGAECEPVRFAVLEWAVLREQLSRRPCRMLRGEVAGATRVGASARVKRAQAGQPARGCAGWWCARPGALEAVCALGCVDRGGGARSRRTRAVCREKRLSLRAARLLPHSPLTHSAVCGLDTAAAVPGCPLPWPIALQPRFAGPLSFADGPHTVAHAPVSAFSAPRTRSLASTEFSVPSPCTSGVAAVLLAASLCIATPLPAVAVGAQPHAPGSTWTAD